VLLLLLIESSVLLSHSGSSRMKLELSSIAAVMSEICTAASRTGLLSSIAAMSGLATSVLSVWLLTELSVARKTGTVSAVLKLGTSVGLLTSVATRSMMTIVVLFARLRAVSAVWVSSAWWLMTSIAAVIFAGIAALSAMTASASASRVASGVTGALLAVTSLVSEGSDDAQADQ